MFIYLMCMAQSHWRNGGIEASAVLLNGNNVQGHVMETVQMERLKM